MFPVSVCLRIESKRFVEEEMQRKRLDSHAGRIRVPDLRFSGGATKMVALLPMNERYIRWYTPWLSREFEMLAFGNGGGLPLIIFPTSFGSYYQNKDFGLVGVSERVRRGGESYQPMPGRHRSGKFLQQINPPSRSHAHP